MLCSTTLHQTEVISLQRTLRLNTHTTETDFELVRSQDTSPEAIQSEEPTLLTQNPSDTIIQISINNQGLTGSPPSSALTNQACFLRKVCAILVSFIIWTILIRDEENPDKRLENLYLVACFFLIYMVFEDLVFCLKQELSLDDYEEVMFDVLDGFLGLCFMVGILFKNIEKISQLLLIGSSCFFLLSTSLYAKIFVMSSTRNLKILRKLTLTIQISLITSKILGFSSLNWTPIFLPIGLYLAFQLIYGTMTVIKSLIHFYRAIRDGEIDSSYPIKACLKITWYILYYGLSSFVFAILAHLCGEQTEDEEDKEWTRTIFIITEYYCCFFFGYTLIFFKLSKDFGIDLSQSLEVNPVNSLKSRRPRRGHSIKPTKKLVMSYFSKLSPTYFSKIDNEEEGEVLISKPIDMEENPCYICETDQPDIILMGCGHGGMCKDCALMSIKKNNSCMECRAPVQAIYQIEKEDKEKGRVKACEIFNIVS